jgi:hypothetical protein
MAPPSVFNVRSRKFSSVLKGRSSDGWPKIYYLKLRASEGTLRHWSQLHLQALPGPRGGLWPVLLMCNS